MSIGLGISSSSSHLWLLLEHVYLIFTSICLYNTIHHYYCRHDLHFVLLCCGFLHHDDVMKWKHFQCYWPFVWGIHWSPVNSPHKVQWCRALIFSLIFILTNGWVHNWDACDLRCHRSHYDVTVMTLILGIFSNVTSLALGQSYAGLLGPRAQGPWHGIPENRPFWNYPWGPNDPHQMEEFIFVFLWWEIPHKISYPYIERCGFYSKVKI